MKRDFIPETEAIIPEGGIMSPCEKPENHSQFCDVTDLCLDHFPDKWRDEKVLQDFQVLSKYVVRLTVLMLSPDRMMACSVHRHGSGFLTIDLENGALVHTSKHVVWDPLEAKHTVVRLFYDDEEKETIYTSLGINSLQDRILGRVGYQLPASFLAQSPQSRGLFLTRGSTRYFRSVMDSDYTVFSCELPVHELFPLQDQSLLVSACSWWNFSLRRFMMSRPDIDVAIISHPHGEAKKISFGKMTRLMGVTPALYDAPTCGGSSGAPVIRLNSDSAHYLSAGQFVHHGHNKSRLNLGMGTVRPPVLFPYWKRLDTDSRLYSAVSLLYEPVFYWTLVICDLMHVTSTVKSSIDVFAYTSSFSAFALTVNSWPFLLLNSCFWLHLGLTCLYRWKQIGAWLAVCQLLSSLINTSAFLVGWTLLCLPSPWSNMFLVSGVWLVLIYLERHLRLSSRFTTATLGSFPDVLKLIMIEERGLEAKRSKSDDLITTMPTDG
ncbi:uncharacterized protein LOC101853892 [Aplysia californica]|uniref:Uncharacterized protein LOC101853892 n=1 Tax=Aplysia californica TaxID=6500 RepID=A0ABM1W2J9_APLCA|nr:uncharacterized protein LOC101853892 [Aplysia californica]XP_035828892.1 uncharacterized protein LOC101853892 [Aplysia californica]